MEKLSLLESVLVVSAGSLLLSGCVYQERVAYRQPPPSATVVTEQPGSQEIVVTEAPPAPLVEAVPVAPGPGFIWIGGCWVWRSHWVWERGHWARPPHHGAVWVPHRYVYRNGVHVFISGGWR